MVALACCSAGTAENGNRANTFEIGIADYGQYGVPGVGALLRVATRLNMGVVRLTMEWSPGQRRLSPPQQQIMLLTRRYPQLEILYTLSFDRGRDAPVTERARRQFVSWAEDLVRNGAVDVEATNEPMQPLFWSTVDAAQQYAALLAELYPALHRANRDVLVIAGSLARHHATSFMSELTAALAGRKVADAVSLHYPASLTDYERRVELLRACFGAGLPVYVTEDGSVRGDNRVQGEQLASEMELAWDENAVAWILLQLQDRPDLMPWHTGLYRHDWARQPAYYAVVRTWREISRQDTAESAMGNFIPNP